MPPLPHLAVEEIKLIMTPFAPETLLSFFAPTGHSAILLPSAPFLCQQL